jgi:hypothetical protein
LLVGVLGCSSSGGGTQGDPDPAEAPDAGAPATPPPAEAVPLPSCSGSAPAAPTTDLPPGAETTALPTAEGDLMDPQTGAAIVHYAISTPKTFAAPGTTDPAKQLGLIVCFHEHDNAPKDELPSVVQSLQRLKLSGDFVAVCMGQGDLTTHGYTRTADHRIAVKLIDWARKTYPINPRRVYLWGRGEGATMAQEFGTEHPELITALITYSWGSTSLPRITNPTVNAPDFYVVLGLKDLQTHLDRVRAVYAGIKMRGYNVIYREIAGLGGATRNPLSNDDAILWASRLRHKTMPLAPAEQDLIKPFQDPAACLDADGLRALLRVGGLQAGRLVAPLLNATGDATRAAVAAGASLAMFGNEVNTALGARLKDPAADVRRAALRSLAVAANWRYLPAQQALIDVATDGAWDAAERALAIDGIGAAIKLQSAGAFQDPPLFKALVTLLGDPDVAIRTRAFGFLSPIMASSYKPDASDADRAAALQAWQQWLAGISAKP